MRTTYVSSPSEKLWLGIDENDDQECYFAGGGPESRYLQLGSQISRFHVDCEIGMPVSMG